MKSSSSLPANSNRHYPGKIRKAPLTRNTLILALVIAFPWLAGYSVASAQPLSYSAKISLITVAPGEELYSGFGHSAFWVYDPLTGLDKVYNYGTFDFRTGNFYIKFIRGKLPYMLSAAPINNTLYGAQYEDRGVYEDELNLTYAQKQRLFDLLEINIQPQNRFYKYDFLYDNCSTRLRDILQKACGDSVQFRPESRNMSFRDWIQYFMNTKPFIRTGMDLMLGIPTDKTADAFHEMFLPDNLRDAFRKASIRRGTGEQPLVTRDATLYTEKAPVGFERDYLVAILSGALFLGGLLWTRYQLKAGKTGFGFDKGLFFVAGLLGCLMVFLWFATDHYVTRSNWNVLWAIPLHVVAVFFLRRRAAPWVKTYFTATMALSALAFLLSGFTFVQEFSLDFTPVVALLALRAWYIQRQLSTSYARS